MHNSEDERLHESFEDDMNRSLLSQLCIGTGFSLCMMRFRRSAHAPSGTLGTPWIPVLLVLAFALCASSPALSQEEEVPQADIMGGYSYLHSSDTNFNGWKATLVGNVNAWLGIAADFDGDYAGARSEHSVTFGPHFVLRKNKRWTPVGYALFGVAFEKSEFGETEHGFATELGGGLDYEASHRWTVRVFDVTASITHVGGETHTSPKVGVGLIFNIGHK